MTAVIRGQPSNAVEILSQDAPPLAGEQDRGKLAPDMSSASSDARVCTDQRCGKNGPYLPACVWPSRTVRHFVQG
jgi:hypothetical protein